MLATRCRVFNAHCLVLDTHDSVLGTHCRVMDTPSRVLDTTCSVVGSNCRVLGTHFRVWGTHCRVLDIHCRVSFFLKMCRRGEPCWQKSDHPENRLCAQALKSGPFKQFPNVFPPDDFSLEKYLWAQAPTLHLKPYTLNPKLQTLNP